MSRILLRPGDAAFFADALDLDLVEALHRRHRLFIAWSLDQDAGLDARQSGPPAVTLTLDGDPHAMVDEILFRARLATRLRAEASRMPAARLGPAVREICAILERERLEVGR